MDGWAVLEELCNSCSIDMFRRFPFLVLFITLGPTFCWPGRSYDSWEWLGRGHNCGIFILGSCLNMVGVSDNRE